MNKIIFLLFTLILFTGCSHQLNVKNLDAYYSSPQYMSEEVVVAITPAESLDGEFFIEHVIDALRASNIKVKYPYNYKQDMAVDHIIAININTKYKGNPTNFLVSWPGWIIFTSAWAGYGYSAEINTEVRFLDPVSFESSNRVLIETDYKARHAEFDRTWTVGMDWLLTYGLSSLIGGIYYTTFDVDIKSELNRTIAPSYGKYAARNITRELY